MEIPGSELLSKFLHVLSQSLLIPCITVLIFFLITVLIELGGFMAEFQQRRREQREPTSKALSDLTLDRKGINRVIKNYPLSSYYKELGREVLALTLSSRKILVEQILNEQALQFKKKLEKTELLARLGPILGMLGTLIPLGPGLAALGQGDLRALAQSVTIAFDTTVAGLTVGGIALIISKVRKTWYEEQFRNLETFLEICIGGEDDAAEKKTAALRGRGT